MLSFLCESQLWSFWFEYISSSDFRYQESRKGAMGGGEEGDPARGIVRNIAIREEMRKVGGSFHWVRGGRVTQRSKEEGEIKKTKEVEILFYPITSKCIHICGYACVQITVYNIYANINERDIKCRYAIEGTKALLFPSHPRAIAI